MSDFIKQTNIPPPPSNIASSSRPCFVVLNPSSGVNVICGVVWISSVSTDRLVQREENRIHPLDGECLQKKERKKENAANLHEVNGIILMRKRGNFSLIPRRPKLIVLFRTKDFLFKMAFTFQSVCARNRTKIKSTINGGGKCLFWYVCVYFHSLHFTLSLSFRVFSILFLRMNEDDVLFLPSFIDRLL